jgi:hypothetical protein
MPSKVVVELRCIPHKDGTFNVGAFENGEQVWDDTYSVQQGDFEDIVAVYRKLQAAYPGVPIQVRFITV